MNVILLSFGPTRILTIDAAGLSLFIDRYIEAKITMRTDSKVYDELEEITGLDRRTIQDYKTVVDRVPSAGRHAYLSFSQHREVAKLPESKHSEFLTRASEEKLSVRELR